MSHLDTLLGDALVASLLAFAQGLARPGPALDLARGLSEQVEHHGAAGWSWQGLGQTSRSTTERHGFEKF